MSITCMITWLASLVPSFFVSYLAFFVFFVQETYTLHNRTLYEYLVYQFHIHKADQKLTQSRVFTISYHCKGEILPGNIQLNDLFYHVLCMKSYLIKSQRRTSYKGIHFFQLGSPPPNKAKTQFKTFSVLLFCNHIKLNFNIFTSSCNVFNGLDCKSLFSQVQDVS